MDEDEALDWSRGTVGLTSCWASLSLESNGKRGQTIGTNDRCCNDSKRCETVGAYDRRQEDSRCSQTSSRSNGRREDSE